MWRAILEANQFLGLCRNISRTGLFVKMKRSSNIEKLDPYQRVSYVSREEDKEIENCVLELFKPNLPNRVNVIVLHGPGGYGKSWTAGNLVDKLYISKLGAASFRFQENGNPKWTILKAPIVKWTLSASNEESLFDSYRDLANALDLQKDIKDANHQNTMSYRTSSGRQHNNEVSHVKTEGEKDSGMKNALESIYQSVTEKLDKFAGFVLIVDGADKYSAKLARYWPKEGELRKGKGLVVITTQDPHVFPKGNKDNECFIRKVSVGKMKDKDAMTLLEKSSGLKPKGNEKQCVEDIVVKELDCIPQDIASLGLQLSALVKEKGEVFSFATLKKLLEERRSNETPESMRTESISGLLVLLHTMRKGTTEVFKLLSCCSGEYSVPLKIIEDFVASKDGLLDKLRDSEFLEVKPSGLISLHQRQHRGLRRILTKKWPNKENSFFGSLLNFLWKKTGETPVPSLTHEDISKAIQCMSKACKGSMQYKSDQEYAMIKQAHPHLKELLQVARELGFEDKISVREMAAAHACLGESYLFRGSSENASKHLKEARHLYQRESDGDYRLEEATVTHFLGEAHSYRHLGSPHQGEHLLRKSLKMKEDIFGKKDNPEIALTLTSLANNLNEQGRHTEAIECLERAKKVFESLDKDNANCRQENGFVLSGLGSSYRFLGHFNMAEKLLKHALKVFEDLENPSDMRVGVTLSRLASVQRELMQFPESIESLKKAQAKFGKNKEYQAVIYSKLSVVYRYKGDDELSLDYAEKAKSIIQEIGKNKNGHPGFATACRNLGHAMSDLGKTSDALEHLQYALKSYENLHGKSHRTTGTTLNYIGSTFLRRGEVTEAKEQLEQAYEIMKANCDSSDPGRANTLKRLSKALRILGELPRSLALAHEALEICQKVFDGELAPCHREIRKCDSLVAKAYSDLGFYEKAKKCMDKAIAGFKVFERKDPLENARIQRYSAEIRLDHLEANMIKDKDAQALQTMKEAKVHLKKAESLSTRHLQTGLIVKEKARLLLITEDTNEAYSEVMKSLKIVKEACEEVQDHYVVADVAVIKSDVERKLNMYDESMKTLQNALAAYRREFGSNNPSVAKTLMRLCLTSLEAGNNEEATKYYHESKKICDFIKEDLARQIKENEFEGSSTYKLEEQFPLFKFQNSIRKLLNMPKERERQPGEYW